MIRENAWKLCLLLVCLALAVGCTPTPREFDPPPKTSWSPEGCRRVPHPDPILGNPSKYHRTLHADSLNSDEVSIALTPVFEVEWIVEPHTFIVEGPTFDRAGNIYYNPLMPAEDIFLISLDPQDGSRRWVIPGAGNGGGAPLILNDPDHPGQQIVYQGSYNRVVSVKTDGTILWDVSTGLPTPTIGVDPGDTHCFSVHYHPQADALVGVTGDGHIFVLDRATGTSLLAAPYELPGEKSPAGEVKLPLNDQQYAAMMAELRPMFAYGEVTELMQVLKGNGIEVANSFAIDPNTGRMWIAATAPDGEDGTIDGVSEYGALYCLELHTTGGAYWTVQEMFHTNFEGGTSSSPALNQDGTRVYTSDNFGNLIAFDASDGSQIWEYNIGAQIMGSVSVASDNGELYTSDKKTIIQIIDRGTYGEETWHADLDMYNTFPGQANFRGISGTIGANGFFGIGRAGFVLPNGTLLPLVVGAILMDRQTGDLRYFTPNGEETFSTAAVGPDGALYIGNGPVNRAIARALFGDLSAPLTGGIIKYAPRRLDLLIRDAVCAASDRALNAFNYAGTCPDSADADMVQIQTLIDQARGSSAKAIADGDLTPDAWEALDGFLVLAEGNLSLQTLDTAAAQLGEACNLFPN